MKINGSFGFQHWYPCRYYLHLPHILKLRNIIMEKALALRSSLIDHQTSPVWILPVNLTISAVHLQGVGLEWVTVPKESQSVFLKAFLVFSHWGIQS
jgi:hypothetical protein